MRAFQTALKPSRSLKILSALLHPAAAAVCLIWFDGWMMWLGLGALAGSFIHSRRVLNLHTADAVRKIAIDRHARATVFYGADEEGKSAVLDDTSVLTPYVLFFQWNTGSQTIRHCIMPDMADKESYRRLKVWARWCRGKDKTAEETEAV